jgi:hypothetical protein
MTEKFDWHGFVLRTKCGKSAQPTVPAIEILKNPKEIADLLKTLGLECDI